VVGLTERTVEGWFVGVIVCSICVGVCIGLFFLTTQFLSVVAKSVLFQRKMAT
jgi:predicted PurR-regulated permease PerM